MVLVVTTSKSLTLARDTFKLGTTVVLVTVNGAVPLATLLTKKLAVILPAVAKLPEVVVPVTVKLVNVPVLVMFGCAAVVNVPVNKVALNAPVAALKDKLAFELNDKFPVVLALTNVG